MSTALTTNNEQTIEVTNLTPIINQLIANFEYTPFFLLTTPNEQGVTTIKSVVLVPENMKITPNEEPTIIGDTLRITYSASSDQGKPTRLIPESKQYTIPDVVPPSPSIEFFEIVILFDNGLQSRRRRMRLEDSTSDDPFISIINRALLFN